MSKKYKTPKHELKCVKYWDKHFQKLDFWLDWTVVKAVADSNLPDIMEELGCGEAEAREVVWGAFIVASHEDGTPMDQAFEDLVSGISDREMPLFLCRLGIGTDMYYGYSEKEAVKMYKEWMDDDPSNPIFGEWKLTKGFKVIPLS